MLTTIISGGQTGADQGGLRAGYALGLRTGGWAPAGYPTLDGPAPWLASYGLIQTPLADYPTRTLWNVRDSDATVRFAVNFNSPGERCTLNAIKRLDRPHFAVVLVRNGRACVVDALLTAVRAFQKFMETHSVRVLNVAGNSERTAPGIGEATMDFLVRASGSRS